MGRIDSAFWADGVKLDIEASKFDAESIKRRLLLRSAFFKHDTGTMRPSMRPSDGVRYRNDGGFIDGI